MESRRSALGDASFDVPQRWPDWLMTDVPGLARYVSPAALDDLGLATPEPYVRPGWEAGSRVAGSVYDTIRGLGLRYSLEAWRRYGPAATGDSRQRIRYPARIRRDCCGTCLDLAILYATALMRAQIRPFIAITYRTVETGGTPDERVVRGEEGHAFVVADLRAPLQQSPRELPAGSRQVRPGELWMSPAPDAWPAQFLAIDPTRATSGWSAGAEPCDFAAAAVAGAAAVADAQSEIVLCDVVAAQDRREYWPLGRPADEETPAIWTRLPEMPAPRSYPSRRQARDTIMHSAGHVVIHGQQGFGKSMLGYERALAADSGYGWLLNAADPAALQSEFARVEIEQQARGGLGQLDRLDRLSFSEAARRRLEVSNAPWVLVIDNANGDPGTILPLLPRAPKNNQTIIITTTNDAWLSDTVWPWSVKVTLEALTDQDMTDVADIQDRLGGSPLYYEAARLAARAGAAAPGESTGAVLVEQLAMQVLADDAAAIDLAHLVAWSPPVALPLSAFAAFSGAPMDALGDRIAAAGLVRRLDRTEPSVLMHRLIAAQLRATSRRIRSAPDEYLPVPVALLADDAGQRLMISSGDAESFETIEAYLKTPRPAQVSPRSWGLAQYGVARAGELRGRSAQSADFFEDAIGLLDSEQDASKLSECWNGRARHVKDHPPRDRADRELALDEAFAWAQRAEVIARSANERSGSPWDIVRAERARAMQALVKKAQARDIGAGEKKALLEEALKMLRESEAERVRILDALGEGDSPDRDRAKFNLGGVCIDLAKLSVGPQAEAYLREAREVYEAAKEMRVRRHGEGIALPSITACDNGLALAFHYGALLAADPLRDADAPYNPISGAARLALLRRATASAWDALRDRTALSAADFDDDNALKSDDLMIKILETRKLVSAHARAGKTPLTPSAAERALSGVENETRNEAMSLGGIVSHPEESRDGSAT